MKKAIVLLSGGLDSATTLYWAKQRGYLVHALVFDYGQRHRREIRHARRIARAAGIPARVLRIAMPWGGSALTGRKRKIPSRRRPRDMARGIPSTYVPARNTIFLSMALSCAEALGAQAICIGANALDYSGYPDCRPAYYRAFARMAKQGTKQGVQGQGIRVLTPLIRKSKAQIVRLAKRLGVPYQWTWSCYVGGRRPCRKCDSCVLRQKGFNEEGTHDPANG